MRLVPASHAAITLAISTIVSAQQLRTGDQVAADLMKAVRVSIATYRSSGMSGLIGKSRDCYKQLAKFKYYCMYLDLAARRIDQQGGASTRFSPTEYFADQYFGDRAGEIFIRTNLSRGQANEYILNLTPVMNKLVEEEVKKDH